MAADPEQLLAEIDLIEDEVARLWPGLPPPSDAATANGGAFGMATMAFPQWLRFVFVPVARQRISTNDLPGHSEVSIQAVRELDGHEEAGHLIDLLTRFDASIASTADQ